MHTKKINNIVKNIPSNVTHLELIEIKNVNIIVPSSIVQLKIDGNILTLSNNRQ
uniref:Uncharacterized protein n=1 Tax=viral metagenome TaxID=1070528 RepID=A0A6C0CA49_9ZZZZ